MRSLAAAMNIAPEAASSASVWYSGPTIPSRRKKPSATRAATMRMHEDSTTNATEKPSIASDLATAAKAPCNCTTCQRTSEATREATEIATVIAVYTTVGSCRTESAPAISSRRAPPMQISSGMIAV